MKLSHKLDDSGTTPRWGLILGVLMIAAGAGRWFYASAAADRPADEWLATAAVILGVFLAIYSWRELRHRHG
jgi:hypothetical protein